MSPTTASPKRPESGVRRFLGSALAGALTTPHGVERYLELLRPETAVREVRARVERVERRTPDSVTLTLRPTATWTGFRAGQHCDVTVEIDGVRHTRCYSPASSEHAPDGRVELTVRRHERGRVSRFLRDDVAAGAMLGLSAPRGEDFALPAGRPHAVALVSGGSGITPVLAILRTLVDERHPGPVGVLHYARTVEDDPYAGELERLVDRLPQGRLVRAYTRGPGGTVEGRVCAEHLAATVADDPGVQTWACGPGPLVDAVRVLWDETGRTTPLRLEHFSPPPRAPAPAGDAAPGRVTFARAGSGTDGDARSLLEQAEDAGLRPASGCRMGICRTCVCRKTDGVVRDLLTGELSGSDAEDVRICVSAPVGDVTLDL